MKLRQNPTSDKYFTKTTIITAATTTTLAGQIHSNLSTFKLENQDENVLLPLIHSSILHPKHLFPSIISKRFYFHFVRT